MMTHPPVDDLPEEAASILLGVFEELSRSRHPGLARWAGPVSDALLIRLVSLTNDVHVDLDAEPCPPLARLNAAELKGLHQVLAAGADASDDDAVIDWCTKMGRLIVAEFGLRAYHQAAIDAKVAVIAAEELRIARESRLAPGFRGVPSQRRP